MNANHKTCLGILVVFVVSGALMVLGGLHYLKKFGSVEGVVVDAATGGAVADASVELFATFASLSGRGGDMPLTLNGETDAEGRFRLRQTVGGNYQLTIRHPDYTTLRRDGLQLEGEAHSDLGRIELAPRVLESDATEEEEAGNAAESDGAR